MKPNQKNPIPRGISIEEAAGSKIIFTTQVVVAQSGAEKKQSMCCNNPNFN
jgi:hypothetical protein